MDHLRIEVVFSELVCVPMLECAGHLSGEKVCSSGYPRSPAPACNRQGALTTATPHPLSILFDPVASEICTGAVPKRICPAKTLGCATTNFKKRARSSPTKFVPYKSKESKVVCAGVGGGRK